MSLKKDKKSWSWLGWLGGSHTNQASAHSNDQLNDTILKHDPAALLTRKTVVESEIYKMTSKLRKSWSRYDGLTHENQLETIAKILKSFTVVCPSYETSFQSIFGDGQSFTIILCVRLITDVEQILITKPLLQKQSIAQGLYELLFTHTECGCELLDALTIISEKRQLLDLMTQTQVTSALVRLLDALFATPYSELVSLSPEISYERVVDIHRALAFLIRRLVRVSATDLMNTDNLTTIVNVIRSKEFPPENLEIKTMMLQILQEVLQKSDAQLIDYLHRKRIISLLINSLKQCGEGDCDLMTLVTETSVLILQKTSSPTSTLILSDFTNANGYQITQDAILESEAEFTQELEKLRKMFKMTADLVFVGDKILESNEPLPINSDSGLTKGNRIKNQSAFQALANTFARAKTDTVRKEVIDNILFIFAEHPGNYVAVHELGTVAWFIQYINEYSEDTQVSVLKLLEYIVAGLNYVPHEELKSLVELMRRDISPNLAQLILTQITKLLQFNLALKASFREAQLFDVISYLLGTSFQSIISSSKNTSDKDWLPILLNITIRVLIEMLEKSPENIRAFREAGGVTVLQQMLLNDDYRDLALKVFQSIILQDTHSVDVSILIEILQTAQSNISLKLSIFNALRKMFQIKESAKDAFREVGFVATISVIINTPWPGTRDEEENQRFGTNDPESVLNLLESLFATLTSALTHHPKNKSLFVKLVGVSAVTDAFRVNGILKTDYCYRAFQCLLDFATERYQLEQVEEVAIMKFEKLIVVRNARILNPYAIKFLLMLMPDMTQAYRIEVLKVVEFLSRLSPINLEALASIDVSSHLLEYFSQDLSDPSKPSNSVVIKLLERMGRYRLAQSEWRKMLQLLQNREYLLPIQTILNKSAKDGGSTPFVEIEPGSSCVILSLNEKSWGSNMSGYTFSSWFSYNMPSRPDEAQSKSTKRLFTLLSLFSEDKKSYLKITLRENGSLALKTASKSKSIEFANFRFTPRKWYHVAITHKKYRLQGSSIALYVNGQQIETQKASFVTYSYSGGSKMRGFFGENPKSTPAALKLGPSFLFEDAISPEAISSLFVAGSDYRGYYQGGYIPAMHLLSEHLSTGFIKLVQNQSNNILAPTSELEAENSMKVSPHHLAAEKFIFTFNAQNNALRDLEYAQESNAPCSGIFLESIHTDHGGPRALLQGLAHCCCPTSLSDEILNSDGLSIVLALIEKSETSELLFDSLSLLNNLMLDSKKIISELERISAYDMVGSFLRKKGYLITDQIHDLLWEMVLMGSSNGKEILTNLKACVCFLFDFEIWRKTPPTLQQKLFQRMISLITTSAYKRWNAIRFDRVGLVPHLLNMLNECPPIDIMQVISDVISAQLSEKLTVEHVNAIKEYLLLTLDAETTLGIVQKSQLKDLKVEPPRRNSVGSLKQLIARKIKRGPLASFLRLSSRNILLRMLLDVVKLKSANLDKFYKAVDIKWFFQFINQKVHPVSTTLALQLWCCVALYNPTNLNNDKMFNMLKHGLVPYCNQFDIYHTLICLLLGRYARYSDKLETFDSLIKGHKAEQRVQFPQAIPIILNMAKHNFQNDYVPHYDNLHVHEYFHDVSKASVAKDQWKHLQIGLSSKDEMEMVFTEDETSEVVFFEKNQLQEELRRNLSRSIVQFLILLHKSSSTFRAEIKKPEMLEDLVAVLFANATFNKPTDVFFSAKSETESEESPLPETTISPVEAPNIFEDFNSTLVGLFSLLNDIIIGEFNSTSKGTNIIDDVLEACPRFVVQEQANSFKSIVLSNLINHFTDADNLRQVADNSKLATSVACFASYIADMHKLDVLPVTHYKLSMKLIVDIVLQLNAIDGAARKAKSKMASMISQAFTNTSTTLTLSVKDLTIAFRALNKMILHLMTMADDEDLHLEIIEKLLSHDWLLTVLDPSNREQDFFTCLYYILYVAFKSENDKISENALTCWRLIVSAQRSHDNSTLSILSYKNEKNEVINLVDGLSLLLDKDTRKFKDWALENSAIFDTFFENKMKTDASKLIEEDKKNYKTRKANMSQYGRSRSTSNAIRKERKAIESYYTAARECKNEIVLIKEQGEATTRNKREQDLIKYKYALDLWLALRRQLFMERAVWYDPELVSNLIWGLDSTEAPQRMRKMFEMLELDAPLWKRKKLHSSDTPCSPTDEPQDEMASVANRFVVDQFKKLEELQMSPNNRSFVKKNVEDVSNSLDTDHDIQSIDSSLNDDEQSEEIPQAIERVESATENSEFTDATTDVDDYQDDYDYLDEEMGEYFKIRRLLEPGENMTDSSMFNCLRITGLDGKKGLFVICKNNVYIIDNFAYTKDDRIIEVDGNHLMSTYWSGDNETAPPSPSSDTGSEKSTSGSSVVSHPCIRIPISELKQVLKRRYLLRLTALELFCADGRNYFVVFERHEMEKIYDKVIQRATKKVNRTPSQKQMTLAWQKGEVSNFEYLMFLNTLAGRSYNDLTQYPVFPWVLQDYSSSTIDLNDPAVYRDLSKPMGALTDARAELFRQRFNDWPEMTGIPKFHYGTHYSSAGVVLHFLMRIEPFTTRSIELQGGKFDHADRMFHSVADTWESAATDYSMSDVKELIPEFFYLPEFLINSNNVDFGKRQNGSAINNVILPPWAKNDPFEFVRINREALESDYVSENLHKWIDLIFGYKQRGKDAEDACNVFYYLTYEGAVDIDAIENEVEREATISQISNFGQTPHQLFASPHPARNVGLIKENTSLLSRGNSMPDTTVISYKLPLEDKEILAQSLDNIQSYSCSNADVFYMNLIMSGDLRSAVATLKNRVTKDAIQSVGEITSYKSDKDIIVLKKHCTMWKPKCTKYFTYGHADRSLRICKVGDDHHNAKFVYEDLHTSQISCAQASDDGKLLILGGDDSVVSVWKLDRPTVGRNKKINLLLQKRLCGHSERITCLAVSTAFSIIVSGSDDQTCIVWDLNRLKFIRQLEQIPHPSVRQMEPTKLKVTKVIINEQNGDIITCAGNRIDVWSINGALLTTVDTGRSNITAICISPALTPKWYEDVFIVTGHEDGFIKFWTFDINEGSPALGNVIRSVSEDNVVKEEMEPSAHGLSSASGGLFYSCLTLKLAGAKHSHTIAITSIFVTKDQKKIYVGDEHGVVTKWNSSSSTLGV